MTTTNERKLSFMPLTLTIEDIEELTNFKEDTLKKKILHDERVLQWERRASKKGKRVWLAEETIAAIKQIMKEDWYN